MKHVISFLFVVMVIGSLQAEETPPTSGKINALLKRLFAIEPWTDETCGDDLDQLSIIGKKAIPYLEKFAKEHPKHAKRALNLAAALRWDEQKYGYDAVLKALSGPVAFRFSNQTLPEIAQTLSGASGLPVLVALDALDFKGRLMYMGMGSAPLWDTLKSPILFPGFHVVVTPGGLLISRRRELSDEEVVDDMIPYLKVDDLTNRYYAALMILHITGDLQGYSIHFTMGKAKEYADKFKAWWEAKKKRPWEEKVAERRAAQPGVVEKFKKLLAVVEPAFKEGDFDRNLGSVHGGYHDEMKYFPYFKSGWFLGPELTQALTKGTAGARQLALRIAAVNRLRFLNTRLTPLLKSSIRADRVLCACAMASFGRYEDQCALYAGARETTDWLLKAWIGSLLVTRFGDKYGLRVIIDCLSDKAGKYAGHASYQLGQLTYNCHRVQDGPWERRRKSWEAWWEQNRKHLITPPMGQGFVPHPYRPQIENSPDGRHKESMLSQIDLYSWKNDSLRFSQDLSQVAYIENRGDRVCMVVNNQEGLFYDEVLPAVFGPHGKRMAYWTRTGEKRRVVLDGKETIQYDGIGRVTLTFGPEGRRFLFAGVRKTKTGKKWFIVENGKERLRQYDGMGQMRLSANGQRLVFAGILGKRWHLVDGAKQGKGYEGVTDIMLSPDGRRVSYVAVRQKKWLIVVDGKEHPGALFPQDDAQVYSADGKRHAYVVGKGEKWWVVVDGIPDPPYDDILTCVVFSPDGLKYAYGATKGEDTVVVVNGKEICAYPHVASHPSFSSDGSILAFVANRDGKYFLVQNKKEGPPFDDFLYGLFLAPDGKTFALCASREGRQCVMVGDKASKGYESVGTKVYFSPDGRHMAYTATEGEETFVVLDGKECRRYERVFTWGGAGIRFDRPGWCRYMASFNNCILLVEEKLKSRRFANRPY
jgi:hypothetical protein